MGEFLAEVSAIFGARILFIIGLIACDVILGVALSLKEGRFRWATVAQFYRSMVIPQLLGWLATAILARFVVAQELPPELAVLGPGIDGVAFAAVVASIGGSIVGNLRELKLLACKSREGE